MIHVRDERASNVRFREELAPDNRVDISRVVLFVLRHVPEVPFIRGHCVDLLQVDLTVNIEDHDELPARRKVRHYEWDDPSFSIVFPSHIEPMNVQEAAVVDGPWFDPALVKSRPRSGPFFKFGRRGNRIRRDEDLESPHLIEPSLVLR